MKEELNLFFKFIALNDRFIGYRMEYGICPESKGILKLAKTGQYNCLQEGSDSFLVKVIRWKHSVLNKFTMYELNVVEE